MGFSLEDFLREKRAVIINQWVDHLKTRVGPRYSERPREELVGTVTEAYDANAHVLLYNDFSYIDRFIEKISQMRLKTGFLLSDVQMAFELFRTVVPPHIAADTTADEFLEATTRINDCLTYTIHRFSDYFQAMHQNKILEHNRQLEEEVRVRTAELMESELKYKTLVEEINDGYFVVRNELIVFANPAFCMMHGYQLQEVIGKKFYTFIDIHSRKKFIAIYEKSFQKRGAPRTFEYLRLTKDGQSHPTEILAKITFYDNKLSTIGICRDITQRVIMEQKFRETERMAYIGQITTSLSHEIRNPLSAVQMNLQILKKNLQLKGNDRRRIDISVREVKRLENILRQMLDFAKPVHLNFNRNSLNSILISSMELLEMKFKEKNIALDIELDPDIPDIQADEEKLGQAVINLMLNALEASPAGSPIKVRSRYNSRNERNAEVVISDNGCGIPEKHLNDIFKPFFTTYCFCGGDVLPVEMYNRWESRFNIPIYQVYGSTEVGHVCYSRIDKKPKPGTIGLPLKSRECIIVNPTTLEPVSPGESGELLVSSPYTIKGYWNKPEETERTCVTVGGKVYCRMGDFVSKDEDGELYYVERSADLIKHKGYRVSASEVEAVLQDHPTVIGACVVGVPDAKVGERIKAIVVLKEDARGVGGSDLIKWCRDHLASYKVPAYIEFRDMLPKSKVGKLLRREIRDEERRRISKDSRPS